MLEKILSALGAKKKGDNYICNCPAHSDAKASLSVKVDGNRLIYYCHAGCTFDQIITSLKNMGLDMPKPNLSKVTSTIEAVYQYLNEEGEVVIEKVRGYGKKFYMRKPLPDGKYQIKGATKDIVIPLYNLPVVILAPTVSICEGEKDCESLGKYGHAATCNIDGAGKWKQHYNQWLKNKDIVIYEDNDEAGRKHTQLLLSNLKTICNQIKVVQFTELPEKGDVSDYLLLHGFDALLAKVDSIPWIEKTSAEERKKEKIDAKEEQQKRQKIPRAKYKDYVKLFDSVLGKYGKDIFSDKVLCYTDSLWQPAIDLIPVIRSQACRMEEEEQVKFNRNAIEDHFHHWAREQRSRFLVDIPAWDGEDRIKLMADCINVSSSQKLTSEDIDQLLSDWLCKAVQRIANPNIRNRIFILKGGQNIGKDTWIDSLLFGAGQFTNAVTVMSHDKDAFLQLSKGLFLKISEFDKTARTEVSMLKELITIPYTDLRASYDRDFKRRYSRSSFIAGCNVDDILRDSTGSTRYIIVEVDSFKFDYPVRDEAFGLQVLAQAFSLANSGFRSNVETEKRLEQYLFDKTPDDIMEDVIDLYTAKVEEFILSLDMMTGITKRQQGFLTNTELVKIFSDIAKDLGMKDRSIRVKMKSLGYGYCSNGVRGYKIPQSLVIESSTETKVIVDQNDREYSDEIPF